MMKNLYQLIIEFNNYQKILFTIGSSIIVFWLLDGFGLKPLEDILFRFINIVFSWNFDTKFGVNYSGYLHPDFLFIICIVGLIVFKSINHNNKSDKYI